VTGAIIVAAIAGAIALVVGQIPFVPSSAPLIAIFAAPLPLPAAIAGSPMHYTSGQPEFRQGIAAGLAHLPLTAATKNG